MNRLASKYPAQLGLFVALALAFTYLRLSQAGLYPAVFADEWYYSSLSRLAPLKDSILPSWLYLGVFRATNACGDAFLSCARLGNLLFLFASAPFVYLIARRVCSVPVACIVTFAAIFAPFKSYSLYFMPETMYFFGFQVLTWFVLNRRDLGWLAHGAVAGVLLGLLSLVKVHGLFLLPALALYQLYAAHLRKPAGHWFVEGVAGAVVAAVLTFAVKIGVGYLLAGGAALNLLGDFYGTHAHASAGFVDKLRAMLPPALFSLKGHLLGLAVAFALPVAVLLMLGVDRRVRREAGADLRALHLYCALMLASMGAITVLYTTSITTYGAQEILRLHLRYYSFVFPLLLVLAAAETGVTRQRRGWLPVALAVLLAAAAVYGSLILEPQYKIIFVDAPELSALRTEAVAGRILTALELALLALWAWNRRAGGLAFVFLFLPASLINAEAGYRNVLDMQRVAKPHDKAGLFAHGYLKPADRKDVLIAGSGVGDLMRAQFHLDDMQATFIDLPPGAPVPSLQSVGRKRWLLAIGDHAPPAGVTPAVRTPDFTLSPLDTAHAPLGTIVFSGPLAGPLLESVEGMSDAEDFGRWSDAKVVRLHFRAPLPKKLSLYLKGSAFGANADQEFLLRAGDASVPFRLGGLVQEIGLRLDTDGAQRTLEIVVPQPQSPASRGGSTDKRTLGLAIHTLEVGRRPE